MEGKILGKLEEQGKKIENIEQKLGEHGLELKGYGLQLKEHGLQLKEHGLQLKEHGKRLGSIEQKLEEHGLELEKHGVILEAIQERLEDTITREEFLDSQDKVMVILKRLDQEREITGYALRKLTDTVERHELKLATL